MATNRKRQKALQRSKAKKRARNVGAQRASGARSDFGRLPLVGCYVGRDWRTTLLTPVVVARRAADRFVCATFVVDLGCLGVKHVILDELDGSALRAFLSRDPELEPCEPALAVSIVETAVRYARGLGFPPASGYGEARALFAGIDAADCREAVRCGKDGQPFFVPGPRDDVARVLRQLTRAVGREGFHFIAPVGVPVDADDDPLEALLQRCGALKAKLVTFARSLEAELSRFVGDAPVDTFRLDGFIAEYLDEHGLSVAERFIEQTPDLSPQDREILLGWRETVFGVFRVAGRGDDHLVLENLVDDLAYRTRSNLGQAYLDAMPSSGFLVGRIARLLDDWIVSGHAQHLPASAEDTAWELAASIAQQSPRRFFRNPKHVEVGRRQQAEEAKAFVAHFGSDEILTTGAEARALLEGFVAAQRATAQARHPDAVAPPPACFVSLPDELSDALDLGLLHDARHGFTCVMGYRTFQEIAQDPGLLEDPRCRMVVEHYLFDVSISPLPFERAGARWPESFSRVLERVLSRPGFSWPRDGERLMRELKPEHADPLPTHMCLPDRLGQGLIRHRERGDASAPDERA